MRLLPFLRQLYVVLPPFIASVSSGGAVSYPTVLLQQLKKNDTTIKIDFETASWMGSIHGLAGIPSIFMPLLMQWKGRKYTFIFSCIILIIGWVLAYFAADATVLLLSESFHGFGTNSFLAVSCLTISEMTSPRYRHTFMQVLYIIQTVGMAADGLLVQYFHWRTISGIMLFPTVISAILACTLPESPYWLAYKGDYTRCEVNFCWLRGTDEDSKKELNELRVTSAKIQSTNFFSISYSKQLCKTLMSKDFFIPALHICVLQLLIHGSGSIVTIIYSIEMLKNTIGDGDLSSFGGLIMNTLFCLGICIGILLDRYFNTKPVLLWGVSFAVVSLLIGSVFSYCESIGLWPTNSLMGLFCLSGFMLSSSIGIIGTAYSTAAVLMPVKHRGAGGILLVLNTCVFHALALKSAPYMFLHLHMWGTYLVYSAVSVICGLLIWKFVPEVKSRSLQEIDNYYRCGSFNKYDIQQLEYLHSIN